MTEKFTLFYQGELSQWYMVNFTVDGVVYNCAEQYMMAQKALLFGDTKSHEKIMASRSPRDQKKYGRSVKPFDMAKWNAQARDVVFKGNLQKFMQNPVLKKLLLESEGTTIVEASPTDDVWGIGLDKYDPRAHNRGMWRGKNWLGETLTKVREEIKRLEQC